MVDFRKSCKIIGSSQRVWHIESLFQMLSYRGWWVWIDWDHEQWQKMENCLKISIKISVLNFGSSEDNILESQLERSSFKKRHNNRVSFIQRMIVRSVTILAILQIFLGWHTVDNLGWNLILHTDSTLILNIHILN